MSSSPMGEPLLSLEGVSRVYGEEVLVHALRDVSLDIRAGEYLSIVGPSGSGKSTMLGLLGVLDLPSSGTIRIQDVEVNTLPDAERSRLRGQAIGFVFQQFHLVPHPDGPRQRRDGVALPEPEPEGAPAAVVGSTRTRRPREPT